MQYLVIIEQAADGSYSTFAPDLPGCTSCGDTPEEVRSLIGEAIRIHIESLRDHSEDIPRPNAVGCLVRA